MTKSDNIVVGFVIFMNKQEVIKILGCSERTVQRYMQEGKLSVRYEKVPGAPGKAPAVFDEEEVLRLKADLKEPRYLSIPMPEETGITLTRSTEIAIERSLYEFAQTQYLLGLKQKMLLQIPEAAALSGLSKSGIKRAIKAGKLPAFKQGGIWKIKIKCLEEFLECF